MAFQALGVPFKLTPQDMGQSNWLDALKQGMQLSQNYQLFPSQLQSAQSEALMNQIKANYAKPMAQQDLQKSILANKFFAPDAQARIDLEKAQAGLYGGQSKKINAMLSYLMGNSGGNGNPGQTLSPTSPGMDNSSTMQPSSPAQPNMSSPMQSPSQGQLGGSSQGIPSSTNSMYGIDIPQPSRQDLLNKTFFGIDTFDPKMKNSQAQIQDQSSSYQKELITSVQQAQSANEINQLIDRFNDAMNRSSYRGHRLGNAPSSGFSASFIPGNLAPEQEADRIANQMLPDAVKQLRESMGSARFSNLDMATAGKLKFDRTMDDETRIFQTNWFNAANNRMKEKPKFYELMGNPQSGAQKAQADLLWQEYQNNFPLIKKDKNGNTTIETANLNNWPLYTTRKALQAIKETGSYIPTASEKNTFMMRLPTGEMVPVKKGKVEEAIRRGAILP